ncbi:MAG: hypothetical protein IJW18_08435 [Lachnospiraceae bacterium]|nr:hypothetical protein [Lachnospiraceae bacterium]
MKNRKKKLLQLIRVKEKSLINVPDGTLRVRNDDSKIYYYHRHNDKNSSKYTYIKKSDKDLAVRLAQKDYDERIIDCAKKEVLAIDRYIKDCPMQNVEQIYETLHKSRQILITPIQETTEQFVNRWQNIKYQGKKIDADIPEIYTARNERVRSKSEAIIADILNSKGIPYRYEYPLELSGGKTYYPDFTLLNVHTREEVYWEHLGMMGDNSYAEKAIQKIATYIQNGIFPGKNLILTYETEKVPLNQRIVRLLIDKYFEG